MSDHYLKSTDESSLLTALESAGIITITDEGYTVNEGYALDMIGTITREETVIEGYHANLRGVISEEQAALLPVIPEPQQPARVWF